MLDDNNNPNQTMSEDRQETKDVGGVAGKRLLSFIERIERLEEEKAGIADDIKDVYAEAKGVGFDTKTIKKLIKIRKISKEKLDEEQALLSLYANSIGLQLDFFN